MQSTVKWKVSWVWSAWSWPEALGASSYPACCYRPGLVEIRRYTGRVGGWRHSCKCPHMSHLKQPARSTIPKKLFKAPLCGFSSFLSTKSFGTAILLNHWFMMTGPLFFEIVVLRFDPENGLKKQPLPILSKRPDYKSPCLHGYLFWNI